MIDLGLETWPLVLEVLPSKSRGERMAERGTQLDLRGSLDPFPLLALLTMLR